MVNDIYNKYIKYLTGSLITSSINDINLRRYGDLR